MKIGKTLLLFLLALVPAAASADNKAVPSAPRYPVPDPFPKTIIAEKPADKPAKADRRSAASRAMLGAAAEMAPAEPNLGGIWLDDLVKGYQTALENKRPLLVVFYYPEGQYSAKYVEELGQSEKFTALAKSGCAVVVRANVNRNNAEINKMADDLKLQLFPVAALLLAKKDSIQEINHLEGYYGSDEVIQALDGFFDEAINGPQAWAPTAPNADACRKALGVAAE